MRGIQRLLDESPAVTILAFCNIAFCKFEVIENALGICPLLEKIIVLEKVIVAERGVRDHQRLHCRSVLLHQV